MRSTRRLWLLLGGTVIAAGCAEDVPPPTRKDLQGVDTSLVDQRHTEAVRSDARVDAKPDQPKVCAPSWTLPDVGGNNSSCVALATDYLPGGSDSWDPCLCDADPSRYVPFNTSISTIARIAAFESMMKRLLTATAPAGSAFVDAKVDFTQAEGLESRVSVREDEHYPAAAKKCQDMTAAEIQQNPDRCVGPARMMPILNQAFLDGAAGKEPLVNAARIESTLLWFLHLSVYKEATTCATKSADCDSHFAYYTGGDDRGGGKGLAAYVKSVSSQTHDRIFDGILAVRCWRDLDNATTATNLALRDKARAQLDRALHRGLALVTRARIKAAGSSCGKPREALWASIQILGGALDREATARDAAAAIAIRAELAKSSADTADLVVLDQKLQTVFPCP